MNWISGYKTTDQQVINSQSIIHGPVFDYHS